MNLKPDIRVVDKDSGKVGYFYSPQQIEKMNEDDQARAWTVHINRKGSHPLSSMGVVGGDGCRQSIARSTGAC